MMKRGIKQIVIVTICIMAMLFAGIKIYQKIQYENSKITGAEYLMQNEIYVENLGEFYDTLDKVIIVGITSGIESEEYNMLILTCANNFLLLENNYNSYLMQHPINYDTVNEFQMNAFLAVNQMMESTHYLMQSLLYYTEDEDMMVYTYLSYKQSITNNLDTYISAKNLAEKSQLP